MKHEKRIILIWNTQVKAVLITLLLLIFIIGFVIGRATAQEKIETPQEVIIEIPTESAPETPEETPTKKYYDCPLSEDLQDYISEQCVENDLPMPLILAMIEVESSFRADVISPTDDYGLMQINKVNHKWLSKKYGIKDFLDPYQNVFCGIKILSEHYKNYGDIDKALMAYNLGVAGAKRYWNIGKTKNAYTERIRASMEAYEVA